MRGKTFDHVGAFLGRAVPQARALTPHPARRLATLSHKGRGFLLSFLVLLALSACTIPYLRFENHLDLPKGDQPISNATYADVGGDPARLIDDVKRAVERSYWGLLYVKTTGLVPNTFGTPEVPQTQPAALVITHAQALLPDGRGAIILAWGHANSNRVGLAIRVGPFGSPEVERAFARELASVLAGKPKPKRGGKFVLPE